LTDGIAMPMAKNKDLLTNTIVLRKSFFPFCRQIGSFYVMNKIAIPATATNAPAIEIADNFSL